ncbi:hypothetical protein OS493_019912 [Desmophyllum pertusum]|uniref:Uncharacterized protein n=1 Tax=Desmophyllum pertusum TaxID=174260 RepID=A0A9W9YR64_9CNID|nr:hypothetical protein OS493_019912 [Desmophyllum pertusum]
MAATSDTSEEETKLVTWSANSTKLLISLRRENDGLFSKGKIRKNMAWQRIADKFNEKSSLKEELAEFYGNNPKILPSTTISALTAGVGSGDDLSSDEENLHPQRANKHAPKKKRKRAARSSASEMIEFLREFREDKKQEEHEKIDVLKRMHEEKMDFMDRFLGILSKKSE